MISPQGKCTIISVHSWYWTLTAHQAVSQALYVHYDSHVIFLAAPCSWYFPMCALHYSREHDSHRLWLNDAPWCCATQQPWLLLSHFIDEETGTHSKVKSLAQGHTGPQWWSWDLNLLICLWTCTRDPLLTAQPLSLKESQWRQRLFSRHFFSLLNCKIHIASKWRF